MCLEMDSRKWKILGFFIRHTEGGGGGVRGPCDICHTFFFFLSLPLSPPCIHVFRYWPREIWLLGPSTTLALSSRSWSRGSLMSWRYPRDHISLTSRLDMMEAGICLCIYMQNTTKIWETLMSTYKNKCGVSGFALGIDMVETKLTEASSISCFNSTHPTYWKTICVLSNGSQIWVVNINQE